MTIEERNDLVLQNLNLVHYVAHKKILIPNSVSYEDVIQEGTIGLMKSIEKFDPTLGVSFTTYATLYIKGYMMRFIREHKHLVKYSRSELDAYVKIIRSGKLPEDLSDQELSDLGIKPYQMSAIRSMSSFMSIDESILDNMTLAEVIPDNRTEEFSEDYYRSELDTIKDSVLVKSFKLPAHRDIINDWYYSSLEDSKSIQIEMAAKHNTTQCQISRIIRKFKKEFLKELKSSGYDVDAYLTKSNK